MAPSRLALRRPRTLLRPALRLATSKEPPLRQWKPRRPPVRRQSPMRCDRSVPGASRRRQRRCLPPLGTLRARQSPPCRQSRKRMGSRELTSPLRSRARDLPHPSSPSRRSGGGRPGCPSPLMRPEVFTPRMSRRMIHRGARASSESRSSPRTSRREVATTLRRLLRLGARPRASTHR